MITHSCPKCEKQLRLRDDLAGKKIKCPECGKVLTVPEPDGEEAAVRKAPSPKKRPRDEEDDAPRKKKRPREEDDEVPDEDDEDRPSKKKKKSDGPAKPSILLMIAGMVLAIGGLIAMSAFIVLAKRANDDYESRESGISTLKVDADRADKFGANPNIGEAAKKQFEEQRRKYAAERDEIDNVVRPRIQRNIIIAVLFGVIFLIGVGVRGYHHFAMNRWHKEHHGVGKKKRRRDEEDEEDD